MVKTKITDAERKRRAAQSARDKASSRRAQPVKSRSSPVGKGGSNSNSRVASRKPSLHPYTRLTLDPCHAKLTEAPFPGRNGSSIFRLPYRVVVTVPDQTQGVAGGNGFPSSAPRTTIVALLSPSAMSTRSPAAGGMAAVSISAQTGEASLYTEAEIGDPLFARYFINMDPIGLNQLNLLTSSMRPIAGCIKIEYFGGPVGSNTGEFFGYEGTAGNVTRYYPAPPALPQALVTRRTGNEWSMAGNRTSITTQGYEAVCNYAAAPSEWQEFKDPINPTAEHSADAATGDISAMPIAAVGLNGGTPGAKYVISGAIVYEWIPLIGFGWKTHAPSPEARNPRTLQTVVSQLAKYGPMLVGAAARLATGGPTLAISDLMYRLALDRNTSDSRPVSTNMIGW